MDKDAKNLTGEMAFKAIFNATLCGALYIGVPYLATLVWNIYKGTNISIDLKMMRLLGADEGYGPSNGLVTTYSFSLILLLPIFQGILIGYKISPFKAVFWKSLLIALAVLI